MNNTFSICIFSVLLLSGVALAQTQANQGPLYSVPAFSGSSTPHAMPVTPSSITAPTVANKPQTQSMPKAWGDRSGPVFIGHRTVLDRYTEWGWVWKEKEDQRRARWVMLEEEPGVTAIPSRFLAHIDDDNNYEYRLYGEFAPYQGYDPNYDLFVPVFRIKGFEVIGPAEPLDLDLPRSSYRKKQPSTLFLRPGINTN